MTPKAWKTLSSREVYQNPWMRLREDIAEMPNGKTTIYGVIECNDCVAVLPFVDDNHIILVRQYRYIFEENHRWEVLSGGVKVGESTGDAARRELREEVGFDAQELQFNPWTLQRRIAFSSHSQLEHSQISWLRANLQELTHHAQQGR